MALRNIRVEGDEILRKKSRIVDKIDDKILIILDDMVETMYSKEGIGLAAPQIGILKRLVVIDIDGDGVDVYKMINPEIIDSKGSQIDEEGCLSVPEERGAVERPTDLTLKYTNILGDEVIIEASDLFARCICHELDHLDGTLFIDKIID